MNEPGRAFAGNLEELRNQLTGHLAITLTVASGMLIWFKLLVWTVLASGFPAIHLGLLFILLGLAITVRWQFRVRPTLARGLLVGGLTLELLVAMALLSDPWLPFLGLMLTFVGAVLVSGGGPMAAGAVALLAAGLTYSGVRAYALLELLTALASGAVMTWLVARTFYTALEWAWTTQQRADQLLELARERQMLLSRALKAVDNTNTILLRTQRDLIVTRKHAEEARMMKEQFAANISHELRTPLSLILGFSEVMCLSPEVYGDMVWSPALRQDAYQIYRNSRHLLGMIDDVLDLSRLEAVGFTLNKESVPLEPLLRDTVDIVSYLFRDRPVVLEVEIAPGLPVVEIDSTRIRQVLLNLLNNAARFTEEGRVRVAAQLVDREVVVSVSDTGPGIPADKLQRVFEEFYQVDRSLSRRHGGSGLGLAISKHFVEAHDGRIWVESQEGVGSTFAFALLVPEYHVPLLRPRVVRPLEPDGDDRPPPVLVVDPDRRLTDLVQRHVGDHEAIQVGNIRELAQAVNLHHPQAIVYNVLPGERARLDGIASDSVPVIECSLPSAAWVQDNLAVMGYLNKPVTRELLLREIERAGSAQDVLVIDDERGFCQLVERILKSSESPCKVRQAYSGKRGLRAMRLQRPDLVLLDLMMPGMDGFQVLEEMRRDPALAAVPVILLTATSYIEDKLAQLGSQVVIRRPEGIRPAEALRCLEALVDVLEPRYDDHDTVGSPDAEAGRPGSEVRPMLQNAQLA